MGRRQRDRQKQIGTQTEKPTIRNITVLTDKEKIIHIDGQVHDKLIER